MLVIGRVCVRPGLFLCLECVCVVLWGPRRSCIWQLDHGKHLMKCCIISFICGCMYGTGSQTKSQVCLPFFFLSFWEWVGIEELSMRLSASDCECVYVVVYETGCLPWTCVYISCVNRWRPSFWGETCVCARLAGKCGCFFSLTISLSYLLPYISTFI